MGQRKNKMVSTSPQISLLLLSALCLFSLNTFYASGAYIPCCRKYSTMKIPFNWIKGVSIQTDKEYCNMNAIIFHTKKGMVCFNPASNWVMDYVNRFRNKAQLVHMRTTHK
ncbi:C-C motif chemokine 4-like [Boleophthalmus pectinirostris]|uniref:C-C motif chemokine 4-like n=1 Tax=Boleophthalmus pectinirostris TaxID=150288 RepID=UPI000A1C56AE|nr:C-C motif chemokine 4-like [Boleophthalmus pectinirostris]